MKLISFSAVFMIIVSCGHEKSSGGQDNIQLAKNSFAAFNRHDWKSHAAFFSDTCRYLDPSYGHLYKTVSRHDKALKYKALELISPDIHDSLTSVFAAGNKVVIQFISSGTAKTGKESYRWRVPICCIFTFDKGLVIMNETYYDRENN